MKKIIQLDTKTINQIAAGEVVENPASVVKELVENSIDAGSRKITVEILDGGFSLIRIIDDGHGFGLDDLKICLLRHTTSKLKKIEDLWDIHSMGFRGEALASISSISEFSILTKSQDLPREASGYLLKNYPEENISPAPREVGTTIEVKSLFYNVPARKAFQKSVSHSLTEIIKVMTKICLGFPHLKIRLIANGKDVFYHMGDEKEAFLDELKSAVSETLDPGFMEGCFFVDENSDNIEIRGILGGFQQARANRLGQYLFINKRAVFSPVISQVVKNAYGTRIDSNVHPTFVLHLNLPAEEVDVNVHPQKKEVRIKDDREINEKIKKAIIKALLKISEERIESVGMSRSYDFSESNFSKKPEYYPSYSSTKEFTKSPLQNWTYEEIQAPEVVQNEVRFLPKTRIAILGSIYHYLIVDSEELLALDFEFSEKIVLINTKALRAKIFYEQTLKRVETGEINHFAQALLFPISIEFSLDQSLKLEKHLDLLKILGIEMIQVGPRSFSVCSLIDKIPEDGIKELVETVLVDIDHFSEIEAKSSLIRKITKKIKTTHEQMNEMHLLCALKELMGFSEKMTSPFGEKIFSPISSLQMDKLCQ